MPSFQLTDVLATSDVSAHRWVCDGCDPARPCDEHCDHAALWLVTAGAFTVRTSTGTHVLDPTHALVMPARHGFVVRHPAGPDVCVAFRGSLIDRLATERPRLVEITPALAARLGGELRAWRHGDGDELAIAELLASLAPPAPVANDRELVAAITHVVRLSFARTTSLGEIADAAGYSLFHACRVFRQSTGHTIHGFRRELRLRHALARVLDGDEPLAEIADATGFASQSHLTNLFRERFGVTPARARTRDGQRALSRVHRAGP